MSRHTPPDHRDPDAFAGLTKRRRERGLPVGPIEPPHPAAGLKVLVPTRNRVWHILDVKGDPLCGRRGPDFSSVERGENLDPVAYEGMVCCSCATRNRELREAEEES